MIKLNVDIAKTPAALSRGLMHREKMGNNEGMIFVFDEPKEASFWGHNTKLALDLAFVDKNNIIQEIREIVPMSTRIIHSKDNCLYAIEANAGFFQDNGIRVGNKINLLDFGLTGEIEFDAKTN